MIELDKKNKRAVLLLSGGIDSYTTLGLAMSQGYSVFAMSFDYGQRHRVELQRAKKIADTMGVQKHLTIKLDMRQIGGSALTDEIEIPRDLQLDDIGDDIPATYVPARNTVFLSVALGWAEVLEASRIFIGVNAVDFSGYPDCRSEYLEAFEKMANLATRAGVEGRPIKIDAPLLHLSKAEIIKKGKELKLDYSLTLSCYDPDAEGRACFSCDSCRLRRQGFLDAGIADPTVYQDGSVK